MPHTWVPDLDGTNTSCTAKITRLAQVTCLRAPRIQQSPSLHHLDKNGVNSPGAAWKLQSAAGSHPCVPLSSSRHLSQHSAQRGQGQMPAFLLTVGHSALPLFLFPFVYGPRSSFQAMRKRPAPGQLEFVSRKIAQEFRAGAGSQACWAGCFVLLGPGPAGGPAGTNPRQSGVSRMPHGLPGREEPEQQSPAEVRDRLCKFSSKQKKKKEKREREGAIEVCLGCFALC